MHGLRKVFIASDDCVFATKIVNDLLKRRSHLEVHTTCSTEKERVGFRAGAWHAENTGETQGRHKQDTSKT